MNKAKRVKKRRGLIDLFESKKLISVIEEKIEKRLRLVMSVFERKFKDALMRLDIRSKAEVNTLLSKLESLEVRIDKLEGKKRPKNPKCIGKKRNKIQIPFFILLTRYVVDMPSTIGIIQSLPP